MADSTTTSIGGLVGALPAVSLADMDARAALLRRVDRKHVLRSDTFRALVERLADDHDALEIDRRRLFRYDSVYFDSPDLRCFADHVEGRHPRFKARTRHYLDTGTCQFEVKLKRSAHETDKRQVDHPAPAPGS